jgi:predicted  nucleic acid-binding Zn-ribbon protein
MKSPEEQVVELGRRRAQLSSEVERIKGRREAALKALEAVRQKCTDKGIDPEKLSEVIAEKEEAFRKGVEDLRKRLDVANEALSAF